MGFYQTQPRSSRSTPSPKSRAQFQFKNGRGEKEGEYLDRWSAKTDPDHYSRVKLYRRRKDAVAHRQRLKQEDRALSTVRAHEGDSEDVRSLSSAYSHSDTSLLSPASSLAFSDLGSAFQTELDEYDDHIETLQQGHWPALPNPRAPALRVEGSDFAIQKAKALKSWGFAQGLMYGGNSAALRDSDRVHPIASYEIGVIFSAPHHTASTDDTRWVSITDPYNTATPFGIVHSKYRKMIIIKVFGEHCICVPIYSHNGRGLEGKEFITEYVSIRDAHDRHPQPPEGLHLRLLAVGNRDFRGRIVAGKSSVKLTEFCSHRYDAPATIEGKIEDEGSKMRLLDLVKVLGS
ncbi:hypothetical protein E0Z10_g2403 [Xylaria hypoxylon]|uniref:DUF6590 domain-containing protein n=1 Tax=Xylaria hypoxylon TaxID=37992 RepID=A0A4Z0YR09_9PEZI|nr:hypothetical protein E0Z10_g2403 [Xylaria hypoxylon]